MDDLISEDWLRTWAIQEPYTWRIPGTEYFLYYHRSGYVSGVWSVGKVLPDGDEETICYVAYVCELLLVLSLLGVDSSVVGEVIGA